mmetsp:Transcript_30758/g.46643  ORF Transcript_30758/g.46643 Transcript_30758/m.46643 type:complete len:493 (+) Transcript_30758:79-1557(+)
MEETILESAFFLVVAIVSIALIIVVSKQRQQQKTVTTIPWAPNAIPILGHALKYRSNPGKFLLDTFEQVGEIFQINMAGKVMIVACGSHVQRAVASAPESILSARQAVADIGFEEMLGYLNVYKGTDVHKGIVKGLLHNRTTSSEQVVSGWIQSIQRSLKHETALNKEPQKVDFMKFIRRVVLRVSIDQFIGAFFLEKDECWEDGFDFIEVFMNFQDDLEDVTAKSVVLPRAAALPLLLWPLKRRRHRLQQRISKRLEYVLKHNGSLEKYGFWLADLKDKFHPDEIAELIVGLLFAAHKNPAIGTAQSYLMLYEHATSDQKQIILKESKAFISNPSIQESSYPTLNRLCLEALRLTAHSIGAVRTAQHDFPVETTNKQKYIIPKGATVALTHLSSSLNSEFWKEPHQMDLDGRPMESYQNDYMFTVFSHGIHKCPGHKLAMLVLHSTVAILLVEYEIATLNPIPPLCFERATLGQRAGPVYVTIRENDNQEK